MRFEQAENLLKLAIWMQSTAEGVSTTDIAQEFNVSRRTAERMRDVIGRLVPQMIEIKEGRNKRWRIPSGKFSSLTRFDADELAELQAAITRLRRDNLEEPADILENLAIKIKSIVRADQAAKLETDLEALLEAEGFAMRPGPKLKIKGEVLNTLRNAVKACLKVKITYEPIHEEEVSERVVAPYGFLYGNRHYMIAWCDKAKDFRMFSLSNIQEAVITDKPFTRKRSFSLQDYAERSFGVFQEEPFKVVWKFSSDVAPRAKEYQFHPTQVFDEQDDGSLLVTFTAGGWMEMCWHLFTWGKDVEIIAPEHLKQKYQEMIGEVIND